MPFLQNAWYLAAWSDDVKIGELLARKIIDHRVVMYRTSDGKAIAMEDRCAHRLAPLSRGRIEADRVVCGYHGLAFGPNGRCVHNPHGKTPQTAVVRTFPVVEKHRAVWLWPGADTPDESQIPDFSILDRPDDASAMRREHVLFNAPWDLIADNLIETAVGAPREQGTGYFGIHILTPETEHTTRYHFAATRWNIRPDSETVEMKAKISDLRKFAFAEQDEPMIAAQAEVGRDAGPERTRLVWLDIEVGVARWRKLVQERLTIEIAQLGATP